MTSSVKSSSNKESILDILAAPDLAIGDFFVGTDPDCCLAEAVIPLASYCEAVETDSAIVLLATLTRRDVFIGPLSYSDSELSVPFTLDCGNINIVWSRDILTLESWLFFLPKGGGAGAMVTPRCILAAFGGGCVD